MMSKLALICITLCLVLCMTLVSATTDKEEKSAFYIVAKIETPLSFKEGTMQLNHNHKLKSDNCLHIRSGGSMFIYLGIFSGCIVIHPGGTLYILF